MTCGGGHRRMVADVDDKQEREREIAIAYEIEIKIDKNGKTIKNHFQKLMQFVETGKTISIN